MYNPAIAWSFQPTNDIDYFLILMSVRHLVSLTVHVCVVTGFIIRDVADELWYANDRTSDTGYFYFVSLQIFSFFR